MSEFMELKINLGNYCMGVVHVECETLEECRRDLADDLKRMVSKGMPIENINNSVLAFVGIRKSDLVD